LLGSFSAGKKPNSYNSPTDKGMNCAFDDKSMKFGTRLEERNIFGYRVIAHSLTTKMAAIFKMAAHYG
jgi:hypothetical protein